MGYIVPIDAPHPQRDLAGFQARALDMDQIPVYAKRIQAKHALFLFDSCFSGTIFALSWAVSEHISYKTSQDESIFRQQFVIALQGEGDVNGDGYVTGTELGEFLQETVMHYSHGA